MMSAMIEFLGKTYELGRFGNPSLAFLLLATEVLVKFSPLASGWALF